MLTRLLLILCLSGCPQTAQVAEEVAMTIQKVNSAGDFCDWGGASARLGEGTLDLLSMVAPGGAVGQSRRYPIGVTWTLNQLTGTGAGAEVNPFGEAFITLKDVEVRLVYDDAVVAPPTERTRQNLPATYVVPTMGTQDFQAPPNAVFDLIPTWVARRLALDSQIWVDTSNGNIPMTGKAYLLATEFRLRGLNAGGKTVVSNWFRWVVRLCRGCLLEFTATPPMRPAPGVPVFPGHYGAEELSQPDPMPARPGVVTWCAAGASQGQFVRTLVQVSQPLQTRQY